MDTFTDPDVEETVFVKPTQVGGTECILNILGYIADQDEAPTMVLEPTDTVAEHISKNRVQPMFLKCDALSKKFDERASKLLELQVAGMFINLSGANSPSQLASKPIRFLLLDEVDKYPPRAGKEADPISLARERTKTFSYNRKIFTTSTPTYKSGAVWKAFLDCETRYHYHVPCPRCRQYQRLRWRQVQFDKELEKDSEKADSAYYACEYCSARITDADKADMLESGKWIAEQEGSRKKIGFHLNAIYSPWVTFRDVVAEFLKSKKTPETLMNFINSWLAEPFEQVSSSSDSEKILDCQGRYGKGIVPLETRMITGGVDKQRNCYYYTIRAWGTNRSSWNIAHGKVETEAQLVEVFDRPFPDENGVVHYVEFVLIDSGDDTDVVYDFCYLNRPLFAPVKGSSHAIPSRFRESTIEKKDSRANGMQLILCDGSYYKDMIFRRINSKRYKNWYVYRDCDREYATQIAAEHKVLERVGGRDVYVWKPKASGIDNHYLDCEVYCTCAADVIGAFALLEEEEAATPASSIPQHVQQQNEPDDWFDGGDRWL